MIFEVSEKKGPSDNPERRYNETCEHSIGANAILDGSNSFVTNGHTTSYTASTKRYHNQPTA